MTVVPLAGASSANITSSVAVYFSPSVPTVNAQFNATSLEVVPTTGSRIMYDQTHQAERVLIVGSQAAASLQVSGITNSIAVHVLSTGGTIAVSNLTSGTVAIAAKDGTMAVYFSPGDPGVKITSGTVTGITNSIAVHVLSTGGTLQVKTDPSSVISGITSTIAVVPFTGSGSALYSESTDSININDGGNSITIDGSITGITNSIAVHVLSTGGTINVSNVTSGTVAISAKDGTMAVYFSPGEPTIKGITNSIAVHVLSTGGTINVSNLTSGTIAISAKDGTLAVYFSPNAPSVRLNKASAGTFNKVEISTAARQIIAANTARNSVTIVHDNTSTMYIGLANTVTSAYTGTGFPLVANQILTFDDYTGAVFGVLESGASNAKYIET